MSLRYSALALALLLAPGAAAQDATCSEIARAEISLSDVRTSVFNNGALFWLGGRGLYDVPKSGTIGPIFAAGLWAGGTVGGEPRIAASDFGNWEFRPGPLGSDGLPEADPCGDYNQIYRVSAPELAAFEAGNPPSLGLSEWPVGLGAPAVDASGAAVVPTSVDQTIDLEAGERPVIYGTETVFWVMNDVRPHLQTGSDPLGVEVRVTAFLINDPDEVFLDQGSFYRVETVNKSGAPIDGFRTAVWVDYDLGDFDDDYIASDAGRSLGIAYNGDEFDDPDSQGYGIPPAAGVDILSGAASHTYYENAFNAATGIPGRGGPVDEWFNILQGRWIDGTPVSRGGLGYNPGNPDVTDWQWDGDPVALAFWTEDNPFGQGDPREPADRRSVIASLPVDLAPGASHTVDFSVLFAQGADRLDSVTELRAASDLVQARYDDGSLFETTLGDLGLPPLSPPELLAPADGTAFIPPERILLDWTPVTDAETYRIELSANPDFDEATVQTATAAPIEIDFNILPQGTADPIYWRVTALNEAGVGPPSVVRAFTYAFTFVPGPLALSNGQDAFLEIVGPGGADPCGPDAESTFGCDEAGGNAVFGGERGETADANGTGQYGLFAAASYFFALTNAAPREIEIRFTNEGSVAYHLFYQSNSEVRGATLRVPFELWDIGTVPLGADGTPAPNDPSDDVRLLPALFSDDAGNGQGVCDFEYGEIPAVVTDQNPSGLAQTERIYAYPPAESTTYADFEAAAAPLVDAAPDGCYFDADEALRVFFDGQDRLLERITIADVTGSGSVADLAGTVIRVHTTDPQPVDGEAAPAEAAGLALAVVPNPSRGAATVRFTLAEPGAARVRVVDVLGRTVAVLAEGERRAGEHAVALPGGLASGVYLAVVEAAGERLARSFTVTR